MNPIGRQAARPVAALAGLMCVASSACAPPNVDLGPAPAGVTVEAKIAYYDVNAGSLSEIRRAMASEGPTSQGRRWAAVTQWRLVWAYQYENAGTAGCELRGVKVRVLTNITFPRWNPTTEPDSALAAWWQQYHAGLAEHEKGHAQLAVKAGGEIVKALTGLSGGNCDALGTRANDLGRRVSDAMRREQADYDAATRHGAVQILRAERLHSP